GEKRKVEANVDLTPLIDVVFQLIIFFMLSATFVVQSSIQIQIPEAEGPVALEQKHLSITLARGEGGPDGKGPIYVDNVPVESIDQLTSRLSAAQAERPDLHVLIRADAAVQTARLVEVLGIASSVGIERYGIAAQPPTRSPSEY
ncbi:MAG TPA: biopolymer transporter ExbD, partial [Candidatus Hydrogenedentes bacterium]|nr:biopolymer transporter ExbD [Candidatus Hydrogenedentota bacterium]